MDWMDIHFLCSKKYLTQKNVVEKVSTNLSQGKVRFYIYQYIPPGVIPF